MLISMGCSRVKGAVNLEIAKPGAVLCQKSGAVVPQLVPKLKESVPPSPRECILFGGGEGVELLRPGDRPARPQEVEAFSGPGTGRGGAAGARPVITRRPAQGEGAPGRVTLCQAGAGTDVHHTSNPPTPWSSATAQGSPLIPLVGVASPFLSQRFNEKAVALALGISK